MGQGGDSDRPRRGADRRGLGAAVPVHFAASLGEAVALARSGALPGDAVALSPACASFDQFDSFQARGDAFIRRVEELR